MFNPNHRATPEEQAALAEARARPATATQLEWLHTRALRHNARYDHERLRAQVGSLFTGCEGYTDAANALSLKAEAAVEALHRKYASMGYASREIEYVISAAVSLVCADERLRMRP